MDAVPFPVNWSAVASKAFERRLAEIEAGRCFDGPSPWQHVDIVQADGARRDMTG